MKIMNVAAVGGMVMERQEEAEDEAIRQFREEAALLGRDDILGKILWRKEPA